MNTRARYWAVAALLVVVGVIVAAVLIRPGFVREPAKEAVPDADSTVIESSLVYDTSVPGSADDLTGYLYRPAQTASDGRTPVIVLIHGGGWLEGPDSRYVAPIARDLAGHGYVVWSVNYRGVGGGGGWPTTFSDVARAVDHVTEITDEAPEMDLSRVTVVGHSAGGQLAAWVAGRHTLPAGAPGADPKLRPHAAVSLAGVLDMRMSLTKNDHVLRVMGGTPDQYPQRYLLVDPLERIDSAVPLIAITGTNDSIVPPREAAEYVEKYRSQGGTAALIEIPSIGHGDVIDVNNKWWPTIKSAITTVAEHGSGSIGVRQ